MIYCKNVSDSTLSLNLNVYIFQSPACLLSKQPQSNNTSNILLQKQTNKILLFILGVDASVY